MHGKNKKNSSCLIVFIILILIFGFSIFSSMSLLDNVDYSQINLASVLDVNKFYTENKTNTVTQDELINLLGTPLEIENWNYAINETTSYPIVTLSYPNDERYSFYQNHLAWILIEREISFSNKASILPMFGLEYTKDSKRIVDTDYALRYTNCGVPTFWVSGIENNTFNWVKIVFSETFSN